MQGAVTSLGLVATVFVGIGALVTSAAVVTLLLAAYHRGSKGEPTTEEPVPVTMTQAAAACHVAQPALTRAIRALEQELDLELFARTGRSVEITTDGRMVVEIARRVLADVAVIEGLGRRRPIHEVLTVAATPTIQADLASGLITDFWHRHPDIPVRFLTCTSREEVGEAVLSSRADAGVSDLPEADGLVAVPFESREVVLVAPPGSGLPEPLPIAELGKLALVLPSPGSLRRMAFDLLFADLGIAPTVAFESDERASWVPAVLAGVGCCIWYRQQGRDAAALGAEVRSLEPALHRMIAVLHRPVPATPAVGALVDVAERRLHADERDGTGSSN